MAQRVRIEASRPRFRQSDIRRAVTAARQAGLDVIGFEIGEGGRLVVRTAHSAENGADAALDDFLRRRNGPR